MSERDPMDLLWETIGAQQLANVMRVSADVGAQKEALEMAITQLAQTIADGAKSRGMIYLGGAKAMVRPDWHHDVKTISMKCYAAIGRSPEQFVCFAAHLVEEHRAEAKRQIDRANEYRGRYERLLERVISATSFKDLRLACKAEQRNDD